MDFQVDARIQEYTVAQLEQIILARHGDPIQNLELFKDSPDEANKLASGSEDTVATAGEGATTIFYDYFPPLDPFENRPVAGQLHATNQVINLRTYENMAEPPEIEPEKLKWSKTAEYDPWTQRKMDADAAAEAARIKAEEEAAAAAAARIAAEEEAKKKAKEEEKKRKAEEARKQKEEEEKAAAEAEAARLKKLEEEAMKDPKKRAELEAKKKAAEEAAKKKAAEDMLAALPPRKKGGAIGLFLGGTTREYYGLQNCTPKDPYLLIPKPKIMAEISDKGKIADLYNYKDDIAKCGGDDEEIMICKDEDEVYGDNGFVLILTDADKQHFIAHVMMGNPLPPPV